MINRYMGTQVFRKGLLGALVLAFTFGFQAFGAVFTVTTTSNNAGTPNSLPWAVNQASNAGGATHDIVFALTGGGPYIFNLTSSLDPYNSAKSININGYSQAGSSCGNPQLIIRGNGGGNGFNVGGTVTIQGFIFQNLTNGISIYGGNGNNVIIGNWFGLDQTGTTRYNNTNNIADYGISYGAAGNGTIIGGSTTTGCLLNVFAGCGKAGIQFNSNSSGHIIQNNYLGTDKTGTIRLGIGTANTDNAILLTSISSSTVLSNVVSGSSGNGLRITGASAINNVVSNNLFGTDVTGLIGLGNGSNDPNNTGNILIDGSANTQILGNVISSCVGAGIKITNSSNNTLIKGNKVGTDKNGLNPLPNVFLGIHLWNSNGNTVGGINASDRNLISANGLSTFNHAYGGSGLCLDYTNSSGIYVQGSSNNIILGNYVGTDVTGNVTSASLGNMVNGIKIELGSSNNQVLNNVVGGNGFRSSAILGYVSGCGGATTTYNISGHAVLMLTNTSNNNIIQGNFIGIGANQTSNIGNKNSGVEVQGNTNLTIGGFNLASRNYIGNNGSGITVQKNYTFNNNSNNIFIYNNYIGTNVAGTSSYPNALAVSIQSASTNVYLGTSGFGNLISGNNIGVQVLGGSNGYPSLVRIQSNIIGLQSNGVSPLPNSSPGISMTASSSSNFIGGSGVGQGNIISYNTSHGILLDSTYNTSVQGNRIGVNINGASAPNQGDGIQLTNASRGNIIGGSAAEANTIGFNTGNGIQIVGPGTSRAFNNGFYRNTFTCNVGRAIVLNGANQGYAQPTVSGSSSVFILTGAANSYIQLYLMDNGCSNCTSTLSSNRMSGTLVAEGNSPLTYTATGLNTSANYSALSSSLVGGGISSTSGASVGNNTSEFTFCLSPCTTPFALFTISTPSAICSTSNTASLTISNAQPTVVYTPVLNGTTLTGSRITATSTGFVLNIPALTIGSNFIRVLASNVCTTVASALITVTVNSAPTLTTATGFVNCGTPFGTVSLTGVNVGRTYSAYVGGLLATSSVASSTSLSLAISTTSLLVGPNTISLTGFVAGCGVTSFGTVSGYNNPSINTSFTLTNATVCSGSLATLSLSGSQIGVRYTPMIGLAAAGPVVNGTGTGISLIINAASISVPGIYRINVNASTPGCGITALSNFGSVTSNINSAPTSILSAPTCGAVSNTILTITGAVIGNTYRALTSGNVVASSGVANSNPYLLIVSTSGLSTGNNVLSITGSVAGCGSTTFTTVGVYINPVVNLNTNFSGNTICIPSAGTVTVFGSQLLVTYYPVVNNNTLLGSAITGTGFNTSGNIPSGNLNTGVNSVRIVAATLGCPNQLLNGTTSITGNTNSTLGITFASNPNCSAVSTIPLSVSGVTIGNTYTAYVGGSSVSQVAASTSIILNISTTNLSLGNNTVQVTASVAGCGTSTVGSTNIWLNPVVNLTSTSFAGNTVCDPNNGSITVTSIQPLVTYYPVLGSTTLTGVTSSPISISNLKPGANIIGFLASINGCSFQNFSQQATIISNVNTISGNALTGSTTCGPATTATVSINGTIIGNTYTAYLGSTFLSSQVANAGSTQLNINTSSLSPGDNSITVISSVAGCGTLTVGSVNILVNPVITSGLTANANPICLGSNGTVTVSGTQTNVFYYITSTSGALLSNVTTSAGGNLILNVNSSTAPVGTYSLNVTASVPGCAPTNVSIGVGYTINSNPSGLSLQGSTTCGAATTASVTINSTQIGNSYAAYLGSTFLSSQVANAGSTQLNINTSSLSPGDNSITVTSSVAGCGTLTVGSVNILINPEITNPTGLTGPSLVCNGSTATLTLTGAVSGVTYYPVINSVNGTQVVASSSTVLLTTGTLSTGTTTVFVGASVSICPAITFSGTSFNIVVRPIPDATLTITGGNVCGVGTAGTVTVNNAQAGVDYSVIVNGTALGTLFSTTTNGSNLALNVPGANLNVGTNIISVTGTGCFTTTLSDTASINVNSTNLDAITVTGPASLCGSSNGVFTTPTISGATSYQWTVDNGATILSGDGTSTVTVTSGSGNMTVSVAPLGSCGTGSSKTASVSVTVTPTTTATINGSNIVCANSTLPYSIATVAGATGYLWSVSSDATISGQNTESVSIQFGTISGTIVVQPYNVCGTNSGISLPFTITPAPEALTVTSFVTSVCQNSTTTSSVIGGSGADTYAWTISGDASIIANPTTSNPTILFGTTPGAVVIKASAINNCGTTTSQDFTININPTPTLAGNIVVPGSAICSNGTGYVYSINTVAGALSYTWSSDKGTVVAGQGTNSITLDVISGSTGNITTKVDVAFACSTVTDQSILSITGLPDISNLTISGLNSTCAGATLPYSIPSGGGATDYIWSVTGGDKITDNGNAITATMTSTGVISVIPRGSCGTGTGTSLNVTVNDVPSVGSISGPAGICYDPTLSAPNATTFTASSAGAIDYQWVISTGSSIASGQGTSSVGIIFGKLSATITVTASNLCGNSLPFSTSAAIEVDTISTLSVTTVLGSSLICNSAKSKTFTVTPVAGAFGYTWSYPSTMTVLSAFAPNTLTSPVIGNSITADFSGASLTLTVSAFGKYCSTSKLAYKDIFVAGIISTLPGATTSCLNSEQEFSIATLPGINAYDWQVSNGTYTVTSTAPNSSIKATFTITGSGSVKVSPIADEVCTVGSFTLSNTIQDNLGNDQALFGPNILCQNATVDYTTTVTGTTFFTWEIPSDAMIITSNLGGNFVRIKFGTVAGLVKATPNTVCFTSTILPKEISVQVLNYPVAHAGGSLINATDLIKTYPTVLDETPITLNGTVSSQTSTGNTFPQYTYTWTAQPAADITGKNSLTPVISPNERETKVYVLVDNGYCYSIDSALVKLDIDYIPKAFSPNEDGANDTWQIDNLYTYKNFKMTVYNKWGSPVKEFSSYDKDKTRMWDGTSNGVALPAAVYYYVIDFNNENGKQPRKGSVTIVR